MNPCFNGSCINLSPGYRCSGCPPGYKGNSPAGVGLDQARNQTQICEDINECESGEAICDPNAQCINTLVRITSYSYKIYNF